MPQTLSAAQSRAWNLATNLIVCITLFRGIVIFGLTIIVCKDAAIKSIRII
jgi:hypothetical protein